MSNSFFQRLQQNLEAVKDTVKHVIKDMKYTKKEQEKSKKKEYRNGKTEEELDFSEIMSERNQQKKDQFDKKQENSRKFNLNEKIQKAVRNSILANTIYHKKEPQKFTQQIIQHSEILKQLQNEISLANLSKILDLKLSDTKSELQQEDHTILSKFSPSFFGGWTERYCIISKNKFVYMEGKQISSGVAGILNFNILSFSITQNITSSKKIQQFQIKVDNGQKNFIFKAQNSQKTHQWFQKIQKQIQLSQGKSHKITSLSNYHRFWRKEYLSQKQFQSMAKTGDILLFRGKKSSSILQRKVTGEQYDHIGVILLNSFEQILIFEANGGFGVGICPWKKFVKNKWYEDQQIMVVRQLKIKRNQDFMNEVTKFVECNIGKQYKFSFKDYFISRHSSVDNQKDSYFCSSLISKLYKKLGLLDQKISSNRYMPYDFSQKQSLELLQGKYGKAYLDIQKIIVFR